MRAAPVLASALAAAIASGCSGSCARSSGGDGGPDLATDGGMVSAPSATSPGAPRPGMIWIPSGALKAGTPPERIPRIAEAELPGTEIPLAGFYIDLLPYPDEVGAIPTTNVTRDDAAHLCASKGKR